jgi:hypothetical protein
MRPSAAGLLRRVLARAVAGALAWALFGAAPALVAVPAWRAPAEVPLGRLAALDLVETDPAQPPLPRPGEERLGPLPLRGVEALPDGRGWRLTVQPMAPGVAVIPPLDLGDGRRAPELRLRIPRTAPFGGPWMGVGGGPEDRLPRVRFPWTWASLLALPLAALAALVLRRWRGAAPGRARTRTRHAFGRHWPPPGRDRALLDAAHAAGRDLLAARFGEAARSWGPEAFEALGRPAWADWVRSLDAARFGRADTSTNEGGPPAREARLASPLVLPHGASGPSPDTPAFPPLEVLLKDLEERPC